MASIYNSRLPAYKRPFGAVKTGQATEFTLHIPQHYGCTTPYIFIQSDGQPAVQLAHAHQQTEGDCVLFTFVVTLDTPGLYFYWFDLWKDYRKLYATPTGEAHETTQVGNLYQLTVYDAAFKTPEAVHGSVMYQIFPDRFFEGSKEKPLQYSERIYRADKSGEPYFWPDTVQDGYLTWDYYGGDLQGIQQKLPYLKSLGVDWIYLNPIFEAHANHRYNTADYLNIDPYLGTNDDFVALCKAAKKQGISIILDGVFSHTGADSLYFNKQGRYPTIGAWQGPQSEYYNWYLWNPDGTYESWWGFDTLPHCNKNNPVFRNFICGIGGVIDTWMQRGAAGFRLDVADELPDDFIEEIRYAIKRHGEDKYLIGEVWEDATNKEAYGVRRKYFLGHELDGTMNYPFRNAILQFLGDQDGFAFANSVMSICENYPPPALAAVTNHLSTHDTVRAITALVGEPMGERGRDWQSGRRLSPQQYELGIKKMQIATVLQFTLPGVPCVYYGDEIGMQGYKDPFNRAYYNWDSNENGLKPLITALSKLRHENPAFQNGEIIFHRAEAGLLLFSRKIESNTVTVAINIATIPQKVAIGATSKILNTYEWWIEEGNSVVRAVR